MDGWMDGWMDGRMDGWMDTKIVVFLPPKTVPCVSWSDPGNMEATVAPVPEL